MRPDAAEETSRSGNARLLRTVYPALRSPVNARGQQPVISREQDAINGVNVPDRESPRGRVLRFMLAFREPIGSAGVQGYVLSHWPAAEVIDAMGRMVAAGLVTDEVQPCRPPSTRVRHNYRLTALGVSLARHLEGGAS